MNQQLQQILCINLASRTDRWQETITECARLGFQPERIEACTPEKAIENSPFVAFNTSQKKALEKLKSFPSMILEDDCIFVDAYKLERAIWELPEDWEILYGGANIIGIDTIPFRPPVRYSPHLFTLLDAWQTHCMIYSKGGRDRILETFKVNCGYNYDEFLRQEIMPAGKCFICAPQVAYQRKSFSDIWNVDANFEHLFEQGNKLLV